jgi:hypothetical protein
MHMLYNSDSYTVVLFDPANDARASAVVDAAAAGDPAAAPQRQGGFEIVDKFARKEIFLQGAMAQNFKEAVQALIETEPSEEAIDEYLGRFTALMHQSVVLH